MFGRVAFAACWFILGFVLLFLYIPIVIVLAVSFTESAVFSFPPQGFSLRMKFCRIPSWVFKYSI